jgi:hypothetical protein
MLIFITRGEEDVKTILLSPSFPFAFDVCFIITNDIIRRQKSLTDAYNQAKPDQKAEVIKDVLSVFDAIFALLITQFHDNVNEMFSKTLPVTASLTDTMKKRLHLLSMFPNDTAIVHYLQTSTVPKNYTIRKLNKDKTLKPLMFREFKLFFPKKLNGFHDSSLYKFHDYLWRTHMFKSPMMKKKLEHLPMVNLNRTFTDCQILQMIFVFCLANWEEVWRHNFPCSVEVVKRLYFLKYQDKWLPDPEELVKYMLV